MTFSRWMTGVALAAFLSVPAAAAQPQDKAEVALRAAMEKETVEGDVKGAIEQYKKLGQNNNKSVAARALVRLGECYEKQGNADARKTYEQVLSKFADQKEAVAQARARLTALGGGAQGPVIRKLLDPGGFNFSTCSFSQDGRYCLHQNDTGDLMVRDLDTGEERRLTAHNTESKRSGYVEHTTISTDNKQVAYTWWPSSNDNLELRLIQMDGKGDRAVWTTGAEIRWIVPEKFTPDGRELLVTHNRNNTGNAYHIGMVNLADGKLRTVKELPFGFATHADLSPDGRQVAYNFIQNRDDPGNDIAVLDLRSGKETTVVSDTADDRYPLWTPDGQGIVFLSNRRGTPDLWLQPVTDGAPRGPASLLKSDTGMDTVLLGISAKGTLLYRVYAGTQEVYMASLDPATGKLRAQPERVPARRAGDMGNLVLSPDAATLAFTKSSPGELDGLGLKSLILLDMRTGRERELPLNLKYTINSMWAQDGKSILLTARNTRDENHLFRVDLASGVVTQLKVFGDGPNRLLWITPGWASMDGRTVYAPAAVPDGGHALIAIDAETGSQKVLCATGEAWPGSLALSRDGRMLGFETNNPRRLLVVPVEGGEPREVPISEPGLAQDLAGWSDDGRFLFIRSYYGGEKGFGGVWRVPVEGGAPQFVGIPGEMMKSTSVLSQRVTKAVGDQLFWVRSESRREVWALENFLPAAKPAK